MNKRLLITTTLLLPLLVSSAWAGGLGNIHPFEKKAYAISPLGSFYAFSGKRHWKNGGGLGLGLAYNFNQSWMAELTASGFNTSRNQSPKKNISGQLYTLDGYYFFNNRHVLQPYLSAGIGMMHTNIASSNDPNTQGNLNVGGGVFYYISPIIAIRVGVNDYYNLTGSSHNDVAATAGFSFSFGQRTEDDAVTDDSQSAGVKGKTEVTADGLVLPVAEKEKTTEDEVSKADEKKQDTQSEDEALKLADQISQTTSNNQHQPVPPSATQTESGSAADYSLYD